MGRVFSYSGRHRRCVAGGDEEGVVEVVPVRVGVLDEAELPVAGGAFDLEFAAQGGAEVGVFLAPDKQRGWRRRLPRRATS